MDPANRMGPMANPRRPEAIEAIYYMWWYTGDPKYRRWGAQMFRSFRQHAKGPFGYSSLRNVHDGGPGSMTNSQESFWLAETLKYFYLLMMPRDHLDLNEWTFTTEAHPLRTGRVEPLAALKAPRRSE